MPIYPPRNKAVRKKEIFEYKTFELLEAVQRKYSKEKLLKLSEKVRTAKMNLIKAELTLIKSYKEEGYRMSDVERIENLDYEIMRWSSFDYLEIIKEVGK